MSADKPRIAICPGSYDPVTNGHLDIITRASRVFDKVVVGVVNQPIRKQKTLFTAEERRGFIADSIDLPNVEVEVFSTLLVDFAQEKGAGAIVKGLRAISDFEYEFEMNQLNRLMAPEIESVYIFASRQLQLPLVDRRQGNGDLRGRCERPGAGSRGRGTRRKNQALTRRQARFAGRSLQNGAENG